MCKKILLWLPIVLVALHPACRVKSISGSTPVDTTQTSTKVTTTTTATFTNPVLPGDYPDPSITKVGNTYWATATSSEWAPLFPLLRSNDLVHWETVGHVFPKGLPDWTEANFWAPEIAYENGKTYIYYTARKKGGPLCVGVASASNPAGPYTDHGALVCQEVGAIDGFPIRDENGQLYLVWKEDANSQNLPTPIWGQRMNEERTALIGEKFELFRNNPNTWEGRLVEGPSIIRRGDYFYIFYAGDACCGRECTYAQGVARARKLTGPWEKYAGNPILAGGGDWKCPGHGTVVTGPDGRYFFLYHAYHKDSFVYSGRQGLLSEFTWNADGWPVFKQDALQTSTTANAKALNVSEEFTSNTLAPSWQWPVGQQPTFSIENKDQGRISLVASPEKIGAVLGQRTKTDAYTATLAVDQSSIQAGEAAGLAAIGDVDNALGASISNGKIALWRVKGNKWEIVAQQPLPQQPLIQLRLTAKEGHLFQFDWSTDGKTWQALNANQPLDGAYLPPWDRGIRVGLVAKGPTGSDVQFDWFRVQYK